MNKKHLADLSFCVTILEQNDHKEEAAALLAVVNKYQGGSLPVDPYHCESLASDMRDEVFDKHCIYRYDHQRLTNGEYELIISVETPEGWELFEDKNYGDYDNYLDTDEIDQDIDLMKAAGIDIEPCYDRK